MRILVADDERDIRETLRVLLETRGHTVHVVANGEEAVSAAAQGRPDLILMDVRMPVMDGIAATRVLRSRPETQTIAIICFSAFGGDFGWQAEATAAGCDECLPKPLEWSKVEQLLDQLNRVRPLR